MNRRRAVYLVLSLGVSVALVALLLSRVRAAELGRTLAGIFVPALLVYMGLSLAATALRAWRYRRLLHPIPISWGDLLLVTFIRNSFDDLLPARIGSLSYVYVLTTRLGFSFESAASTFVVAFVLDFLTLGPFLALAVVAAGLSAEGLPSGLLLGLAVAVFIVFGTVLARLVPLSRLALRAYRSFLTKTGLARKPWAGRSVENIGTAISGLAGIRERRIMVPLFAVSILIRLGKYVSLFALFYALLRSHGFHLEDLSFWKTILGLTGAEATSALPVKGLADFGTWESAWAAALRLMRFDAELAILSGLGIHLVTNLFEYTLGLLSVLRLTVRKR